MTQKKRNAPVQRKPRSWSIAKLLLILGYGIVFAFLGVLLLMRQELFRVGIFGEKHAIHAPVPTPALPPPVTTESPRSTPLSPPQVAKELPRQAPASSPSRHPGEITAEEKQALDDIL